MLRFAKFWEVLLTGESRLAYREGFLFLGTFLGFAVACALYDPGIAVHAGRLLFCLLLLSSFFSNPSNRSSGQYGGAVILSRWSAGARWLPLPARYTATISSQVEWGSQEEQGTCGVCQLTTNEHTQGGPFLSL